MTPEEFLSAIDVKKKLHIAKKQWQVLSMLVFQDRVPIENILELLYPNLQYKPASWKKIPTIYISRLKQIFRPHIEGFNIEVYSNVWWLTTENKQAVQELFNKLHGSLKTVDIIARFNYNDWFMGVNTETNQYIYAVFYDTEYQHRKHKAWDSSPPRLWRSHVSCSNWLDRNRSTTRDKYVIQKVKLQLETNDAKAT